MTFGDVIDGLKTGKFKKASRKGWNGKNQYIEIATCISYVNADGDIVNADHEAIGNKAIAFVGLASQADMLADDWIAVI